MKNLPVKITALLAYVGMVAVNYLATALPLAGRDTGAISDAYPNLFAPAGYTFSIWGLIYLLLALYAVYQFYGRDDKLTARVSRFFIANALLNAGWLFAWHYDVIWLSVLIMLGLLATLIMIANILRARPLTVKERWFVRLPFSVYFGWITVATIANITILFVSLDWNGFGLAESFWAVAILLIGAAIGAGRALYDRNIAYALVLVWAYGGILAKHLSASGFAGAYPAVMAAAAFCMLVFAGAILYIALKAKASEKPGPENNGK